jgi:hypothetical protein
MPFETKPVFHSFQIFVSLSYFSFAAIQLVALAFEQLPKFFRSQITDGTDYVLE